MTLPTQRSVVLTLSFDVCEAVEKERRKQDEHQREDPDPQPAAPSRCRSGQARDEICVPPPGCSNQRVSVPAAAVALGHVRYDSTRLASAFPLSSSPSSRPKHHPRKITNLPLLPPTPSLHLRLVARPLPLRYRQTDYALVLNATAAYHRAPSSSHTSIASQRTRDSAPLVLQYTISRNIFAHSLSLCGLETHLLRGILPTPSAFHAYPSKRS